MELSFDLADKYFWTSLDFWRLGPRRFAKKVLDEPESCVSAVPFLLVSLIVSAIPWTLHCVIFVSLSKGVPLPTYFGASIADFKMVVLVQTFLFAAGVILGTLFLAIIIVWPLRSPAPIEDAIKGKFYNSGALLVFISSVIAGGDFVAWVVARVVSNDTLMRFLIWLILGEIVILFALSFYYDLTATCAFTRLKRRRFLEGYFIIQLILAAPVCVYWTVAFLVLTAQVRNILAILVALLAALLFAIPIVFLGWYFRRRLPRLRKLVQAEYLTYWA